MNSTVQVFNLQSYEDDNGILVVTTQGSFPFAVRRVFTVNAPKGARRGEHAHFRCSQLLIAVSGSLRVETTSANGQLNFELNSPKQGLLIPPLTWATQIYTSDHGALIALCDREYEEADYIRDFTEFQRLQDCAQADIQ